MQSKRKEGKRGAERQSFQPQPQALSKHRTVCPLSSSHGRASRPSLANVIGEPLSPDNDRPHDMTAPHRSNGNPPADSPAPWLHLDAQHGALNAMDAHCTPSEVQPPRLSIELHP
ncbi:hypothetical protein EKO04_007019 [Ascochyta lentis]|uniref:Uncharacterized protein n=1 Tax=Ascochyta lentis TaxID=205686 RepID=A0A8H7J175_9PLEO|nr:hypothetical protein EKO04_007019 [Ascochyta lentis]